MHIRNNIQVNFKGEKMTKNQIEKPTIIIPGAQKSGTTTLFNMLSKHSMVDSPQIKESQFFALDEKTVKNNISWYRGIFSSDDLQYALDASTHYLFSKKTPFLIKKYLKNVKILIILRDPVKRAYSNYLHMYRKVPIADKRRFSEIINEIEGVDFNRIIKSENENIEKNIDMGKINHKYIDEKFLSVQYNVDFRYRFEDPLFTYKYFQNGLYSLHIEKFKKIFDNIKIVFLEELIDDTEKVMGEIFDFLNLEYEKNACILPHKNKTKMPRNDLSRSLLKINQKMFPWRVHKEIERQLKRKSPLYIKKPQLKKDLYDKGREILKKEYDYWLSNHDSLNEYWQY
jgi:hypothetical protein